MTEQRARAVQALVRAESEIALIDRTRPVSLGAESARLVAAWQSGRHESPRLRYVSGSQLGPLRRALFSLAERVESALFDGYWLAGRARELALEAHMVDAIGTSSFVSLACERFSVPRGAMAAELESQARTWIGKGAAAAADEARFCSDDRNAPESLWSVISRRLNTLRSRTRLRVDSDLASVAACGEDLVVIRAGTWLTERAAFRIAEHEITGHLLPRVAARKRSDLLRCGCAGATDDEEGRALLIEESQGLMDVWRRAELGVRHLACAYMRRGATFVDAVRCLLELGAPVELAIRAMLRAVRGGGLGREIAYLPAMQRLATAFQTSPDLERWFRAGRASLEYAVAMQASSRAAE